MKGKRRFQILFSGEHHYTDEEFMDKTDIFDEIMTEIFGCDWGCSMCMDFQGYEKVEAIPIEWIEEWLGKMPKHTTPYFYKRFLRNAIRGMVKDWRKEND